MEMRSFAVPFYLLLALVATACRDPVSDLVAREDGDRGQWVQEILAAEVRVPEMGEATAKKLSELLFRAGRVSEVDLVAIVDALPGTGGDHQRIQGETDFKGGGPSYFRVVSPAYFEMAGSELLQGRLFGLDDTESTLPVAIVNESYVRMSYPRYKGIDPRRVIGSKVRLYDLDGRWLTIVGVVEDGPGSLLVRPMSELYVPIAQYASYDGMETYHEPADAFPWYLLARVSGDRNDARNHLQEVVKWEFRPLEERLKTYLGGYRPEYM
jgi:hypothetical protein